MKKLLSIVAVMALCAAPVMADTLELRITSDGTPDAVSGAAGTFNIEIEGRLVSGDTDGLALFGVNMTSDVVNLCDTAKFLVEAPAALSEFDRNEGLTNPPDMAASGFSGTCDGADGLWQIGGGQNTIGNTGPTLYPVGTVETGVCNSGWTVLAEGTIEVTETTTLTLDTGFANTLDVSGGPSVYPVTAATVNIVGGLVISLGIPCALTDANCDGSTNFLDVAEVTSPLNWNKTAAAAGNPCADTDGNGEINFLDVAEVTSPLNWNTSTGPCNCACP